MHKIIKEAITFDDVLIVPDYAEVLPPQTDVSTYLTQRIRLSVPLISSGMDTVTESTMAAAMALLGGAGIIHRNLDPHKQAAEVQKVKQHVINRDLFATPTLDANGQLLVGAAIGVGNVALERLALLVEAGVDIVAIDTAHGHSKGVIDTLAEAKQRYPNLPIIGGNIATEKGAEALIKAGADAIKVGVGSGSICTTRIIAGSGVPQVSAIYDAWQVAKAYNIPIIADGGLKYSGDIVKALVAGAHVCMLGSLLAGCDECPGETEEIDGKIYKTYRGMGSMEAMQKGMGRDRYGQQNTQKTVAEGVVGRVIYRGKLSEVLFQLVGGLRQGMGYAGAATIADLHAKTRFVRITNAGLLESHPHSITGIREAPNYKRNG